MTIEQLKVDLLKAVRQHLRITWEDDDRDERLGDLIQDGMSYFERLAGDAALSFEAGSPERELLLNYVWYGDAGELHLFESYYLSRLAQFQLDHMVASDEPADV